MPVHGSFNQDMGTGLAVVCVAHAAPGRRPICHHLDPALEVSGTMLWAVLSGDGWAPRGLCVCSASRTRSCGSGSPVALHVKNQNLQAEQEVSHFGCCVCTATRRAQKKQVFLVVPLLPWSDRLSTAVCFQGFYLCE